VKKSIVVGSLAIALGLAGLSARSEAQTVVLNGLGSSGIFLELGQGAEAATANHGLGATCLWTTKTNVVATDSSTGSNLTDSGNAWIAWTPGTAGNNTTCGTTSSSTQVYAYLQTDSVVGNRCLFNGALGTCKITNTISSTQTTANLIYPTGTTIGDTEISLLPTAIATALNNSTKPNFAGTDIRPEDAEFAITRALTACGTPVATGSQYLGLGYTNGSTISSYFSSSTFNVISFKLPASYTVIPVGATPIVVVVNGSGTANTGFTNGNITNLTSAQLANYLDGSYSRTQDALTTSGTQTSEGVTVIIREPLSGTYNTMEYNVPNTRSLQTSQDVGLNQQTAQKNCSGSVVGSNPMNIATAAGHRQRAIGTGQELSEVIANADSLGYGFWSVQNFKGYTSAAAPNAKYLTIDGVDPLLNSYSTLSGTVPTTSAEIADVTLSNVANGSYPIWSDLRLESVGAAPTALTNLATAAGTFVEPGSATPDFIAAANLQVVRSHFIPPAGNGEPTTAANGSGGSRACSATEVGGDVGGAVYSIIGDQDFCKDFALTSGETGRRR
jgi:hypothetical protein